MTVTLALTSACAGDDEAMSEGTGGSSSSGGAVSTSGAATGGSTMTTAGSASVTVGGSSTGESSSTGTTAATDTDPTTDTDPPTDTDGTVGTVGTGGTEGTDGTTGADETEGSSGGSTTEPSTGSDGSTGGDGLSFAAEIFPLIALHCSCHKVSYPDAETTFAALVEQPSMGVPELTLVVPYDVEASYLLNKLRDTQLEVGGLGAQMPPKKPLSPDELDLFDLWVVEGAAP